MIGSEKSNNKRESVLAILDATKQGNPSNPSKLLHILLKCGDCRELNLLLESKKLLSICQLKISDSALRCVRVWVPSQLKAP